MSPTASDSNAMQLIREKVKANIPNTDLFPLIIYINLWSDDFEPNNVKQHKKSTWMKTLTIAPPKDFQTSPRHTYVIALGPKAVTHEILNFHFNSQLKDLQKPTFMYCKATNTNIPIVVETLAVSADRPERSSLNAMLGHNGLCTRRWRYSAYINTTKLKSCPKCTQKRIKCLQSGNFLQINTNKNCCWD